MKNLISSYENAHLVPGAISQGCNSRQSGTKIGTYYPSFLKIIHDIEYYRTFHNYNLSKIRDIVLKKYIRVFNLNDIISLFKLHKLSLSVLKKYLEASGLTKKQKHKILKLYKDKTSFKQVKREILKILTSLQISSEATLTKGNKNGKEI